nr:STAS domain-containing protein [Micromonospora tarapacensis]
MSVARRPPAPPVCCPTPRSSGRWSPTTAGAARRSPPARTAARGAAPCRRARHRPGATAPKPSAAPEVPVVATNDTVDAARTEDALRTALRDAVDVEGTVVVNLAHVDVIDSAGLGLLVRAHREVREHGGRLCLAAPSRFIRTVLHTMKLDGLFPIFDSLDDAVGQVLAATRPAPDETPSLSPVPAAQPVGTQRDLRDPAGARRTAGSLTV